MFHHSGPDQHLALSTVKDQVSALAILFQRLLASHYLVKAFIQVPLTSLNLYVLQWLHGI